MEEKFTKDNLISLIQDYGIVHFTDSFFKEIRHLCPICKHVSNQDNQHYPNCRRLKFDRWVKARNTARAD